VVETAIGDGVVSWWAIAVLAAGSYGCKIFGVSVLARLGAGEAETSSGPLRWVPLAAAFIPAAVFSALIAVQTLEFEGGLRLDARATGVFVSVVAVWRKLPFVAVVVLAMAVTAAIRWQTSG
jgi:branched chain amino acid efflux pump